MSKIATTAPVTQSAPASRYGAGYRGISSSDNKAVDGASTSGGVLYQSADYLYDFYGENKKGDDNQDRHRQPAPQPGLFSAPSESFAAAFEIQAVDRETTDELQAGRTQVVLPTNRIIDTYETNARVITGNNRFRGQNLSFSL
ncbi:MAG: hypothetical protein ACPGNT_11770 [Rhodospirillales bacterium]